MPDLLLDVHSRHCNNSQSSDNAQPSAAQLQDRLHSGSTQLQQSLHSHSQLSDLVAHALSLLQSNIGDVEAAASHILRTASQSKRFALQLVECVVLICPGNVTNFFATEEHAGFWRWLFSHSYDAAVGYSSSLARSVSSSSHSGNPLAQYALAHRHACWHKLHWAQGSHGHSPVVAAAKPDIFHQLDMTATVLEFARNEPAFWYSQQWLDALRDDTAGTAAKIAPSYFASELVHQLHAGNEAVYSRLHSLLLRTDCRASAVLHSFPLLSSAHSRAGKLAFVQQFAHLCGSGATHADDDDAVVFAFATVSQLPESEQSENPRGFMFLISLLCFQRYLCTWLQDTVRLQNAHAEPVASQLRSKSAGSTHDLECLQLVLNLPHLHHSVALQSALLHSAMDEARCSSVMSALQLVAFTLVCIRFQLAQDADTHVQDVMCVCQANSMQAEVLHDVEKEQHTDSAHRKRKRRRQQRKCVKSGPLETAGVEEDPMNEGMMRINDATDVPISDAWAYLSDVALRSWISYLLHGMAAE